MFIGKGAKFNIVADPFMLETLSIRRNLPMNRAVLDSSWPIKEMITFFLRAFWLDGQKFVNKFCSF